MNKRSSLILPLIALLSMLTIMCTCSNAFAKELEHDSTAAKKLEFIRRNLSGLTEMKYADSKKYYESSLKELNDIIKQYKGTWEAMEATFFKGNVFIAMRKFDEAVECFNLVLEQKDLDENFQARTLYFLSKALLGKGDIVEAKKSVAKLREIEPRAANNFSDELSEIARIGMTAPLFKMEDYEGKIVDLAELKGRIIIIHFWATWCEPAVMEFPKVRNMYAKLSGKGVEFIGVSLDDDVRDLTGFARQEHIRWPQIFDGKRWEGTLPSLYHVQALPTIFLIDREGKIRYIGSDTGSVLRIVATLMAETEELPLFR